MLGYARGMAQKGQSTGDYDHHRSRFGADSSLQLALECGGAAVEDGAGFPSTVSGSINSILVPSGSYRLICRLRFTPT